MQQPKFMAARMTCKFMEYPFMTYISNDPCRRSPEAVLREARKSRDEALSALLAGVAMGVGHFAGAVVRGLGQTGRSLVSGVATARRRRIAIRELEAMDDRLLKDIGISRGDIPFLVSNQLSAERTVPTGSGKTCDIAAFPDRQATDTGSRVLLRPAA
jgi:uncharacterized protein YjiS (DUF1127 family)